MDKQTVPISALSPSAARLLLALATANENELFDQTMMRSGICTWKTYLVAKQQLLEGGFLIMQQGKLSAALKPKEGK